MQRLLGLFEQREVAGLRDATRGIACAQGVVSIRHPVHDVIREKVQPFVERPPVQEAGFMNQEVVDFVPKIVVGHVGSPV
jgi:hypothetical protein